MERPDILELRQALGHQSLIAELIELCNKKDQQGQFFPEFVSRLNKLVGGEGAAIWMLRGEELKVAFQNQLALEVKPVEPEMEVLSRALKGRTSYVTTLFGRSDGPEDREKFIGIYVPFFLGEEPLGVLQLIKRGRGGNVAYEEEVNQIRALASFISLYVSNVQVEQTLSRAEEVNKLLRFTREVFSSLNPSQVAYSIANFGPFLAKFKRCAVALPERKGFRIRAISGVDELSEKSNTVRCLTALLERLSVKSGDYIEITPSSSSVFEAHPGLEEAVKQYFEVNPFEILYVFPLMEKDGLLGLICAEASKVKRPTAGDMVLYKITAEQSALALKNARSHHRLPLLNQLERVAGWKERLSQSLRLKLIIGLSLGFTTLLILIFLKIPLPVGGTCTIVPQTRYYCRAQVEGTLKELLVGEGQQVRKGDVLALLDDTDLQLRLKEAQSRQKVQESNMIKLLGGGSKKNLAEYEIERLKLEELGVEIDLLSAQIAKTRIVAVESGIILTPQPELDKMKGKLVARGGDVCELGDVKTMGLEVAVSEADVRFVQTGQAVTFLLHAFPENKFKGKASRVREKAEIVNQENSFIVEVDVSADLATFKSGMKGEAKIRCEEESLGYILIRNIVNFFRIRLFF